MARLYMQGLHRFRNVSGYGSIRLNDAWTFLNMVLCPSIYRNMAAYCWMSLNMSENTLINCSDYSRVLNMPQYSYNNIIIVATNVVMLEFLSTWFVHRGTLLPIYNFLRKASKLLINFSFTMTVDLFKYLNEQLVEFLDVKQQKWC